MDMRTPHVKYANLRENPFLTPLLHHLMLAPKYESAKTLSGHTSSITALLFSPDGEHLASGCEGGVVLVTATRSWGIVKKLVNVSPVTALLWDPTFPMTVVCGFSSGAILTVHVGGGDSVRPRFMTAMLQR